MGAPDPDRQFRDALEARDYDIARKILHKYPGIRDTASPHTHTPWILDRVWASDPEGVRFLAGLGFDPSESDSIGQTPLMLAAQLGMREVVQALLDSGTDVHRPAIPYPSVLAAAVYGGDAGTVKLLVSAGARMEGNDFHSVLSSPPRDPEKLGEILQILSQHGYDVSTTTRHGFSALDETALMGNEAAVRLLLDRGANPNTGRRTHNNPLCAAIFSANPVVVEMLLDAGATARVFYREFDLVWHMLSATPRTRGPVMRVLRARGVLGPRSASYARNLARRQRHARQLLRKQGMSDSRNAVALHAFGATRKHPSSPVRLPRAGSISRKAWQQAQGL